MTIAIPLPAPSPTEPAASGNAVGLTWPNGAEALRDVNFRVGRGEFVSIVGPSGCGKSTLLRLVAGLVEPTVGALDVGGMTPLSARKSRDEVAFVFQQPALLPWRTVLANVLLPLELRGRTNKAKAEQILEIVGLRDFAKSYPHQLSGGMQMRVSIARALILNPPIMLLDEPFAALDDITRQRLNEALLDRWLPDKFTALFVTHNVAEAVFLSQRVLVMSARPGTIADEVTIPFAYPRQPGLRAEPEFARLCGLLSDRLREAHA